MSDRWLLLGTSLLLACGGPRAGGPTENRGVVAGGCLPASLSYRLVTAGGRAHLCAGHVGEDGEPRRDGCWAVDLATGGVSKADLVDEPRAPHGLVATTTEDTIQIHGADQQLVREISYETGRDDGPSAAPGDPRIVGDVVFVNDYDAGPHADVHMWKLDGTALGPVRDPDDRREYGGEYELYGGSVSVLSEHEVVFAEHLMTRVIAIDTRTMKPTVWTRKLRPVPGCTQEAVDVYLSPVDGELEWALEDGRVTPACVEALAGTHGRFGPTGVARAEGGGLVALLRDPRRVALAHLAPDGTIAREVPVAVCKE